MIRLGLCCIFRDEPIKFRTTTATVNGKLNRPAALAKLSELRMANADALSASLQFCADNRIGCFRINSQILPLKTHPECGYKVEDLSEGDEIVRRFKACGRFVRKNMLRTCFHPDQFVVLNSPRPDVVATASRYTRSRLPVVLEYQEEQPNQSTALKRELAIKALPRKAKEALVESMEERKQLRR